MCSWAFGAWCSCWISVRESGCPIVWGTSISPSPGSCILWGRFRPMVGKLSSHRFGMARSAKSPNKSNSEIMGSFSKPSDCVSAFLSCSCQCRWLCIHWTGPRCGSQCLPLRRTVKRPSGSWLRWVFLLSGATLAQEWLSTSFPRPAECPLRTGRKRSSFGQNICWSPWECRIFSWGSGCRCHSQWTQSWRPGPRRKLKGSRHGCRVGWLCFREYRPEWRTSDSFWKLDVNFKNFIYRLAIDWYN